MPRTSNRNMPERDEEGRFTSSRGGQSSPRYDRMSDEDDERDYRASGPSSGGRGRSLSEDEDYADWHAYGHDRGWHAHQQLEGFTNRGHRRDDDRQTPGRGRGWFGDPEGHAEAGRHSHDNDRRAGGRYDDDDDRRGRNRSRDDEGRFTGNGRH